jgi:uncharacterized membrane protein
MVPGTAAGWAIRGTEGALAVVAALAIVVVNLAVSGLALTIAARRSPAMFPMIALPSYAVRMLAVFAAMGAAHASRAIDGTVFSIAFAAGLVVVLTYECLLWARTPWLALEFGKELP